MAGYSVECALKAVICRGQRERRLSDSSTTHDLNLLVGKTHKAGAPHIGLWQILQNDPVITGSYEHIVSTWSSEIRYQTRYAAKEDARQSLRDATTLTDWLNHQYAKYVGEV